METLPFAGALRQSAPHADRMPAVRWLLLPLIPLGWAATTSLFPDQLGEYAALSFVATASLALALSELRGPRSDLHLWVILAFLLVAYFAKFYLLVFMFHADFDTLAAFEPRLDRFERPETLLRAYSIMAGALVVFAAYVLTRQATRRDDVVRHPTRALATPAMLASRSRGRWGTIVGALIICSTVLSIVTLALQWYFGVGVVGSPQVPLPFHLAGILKAVRLVVIPLFLLQALWLADLAGRGRSAVAAATILLLHGVASTLWSTSKSPFIEAVLALLLLWLLTGRVTPKRRAVLLAMIPVLLVLNAVAQGARMLRLVSDAQPVESLRTAASVASESDNRGGVLGTAGMALVMRTTGIEPLLDILNWRSRPAAWSFDYFVTNRLDVNTVYTIEILGFPATELVATAFSTGLLGFLYFVTNSAWATVVLVLIYIVVWDVTFMLLRRQRLLTGPVVDAMLLVTLAIATMEGAVQALPTNLALLAGVAVVGELLVRGALGAVVAAR